jgi:hypothetical protein
MSDEKWWFGLVSRTFAKMCPALGIDKEVFAVHHNKHISKIMAHATVGYCFTGDPENGGEGILLQMQRCHVTVNTFLGFEVPFLAETNFPSFPVLWSLLRGSNVVVSSLASCIASI